MNFEDLVKLNDPNILGVVGSRKWPSKSFVYREIQKYLDRFPTITIIVSGGQPKGVDGWAASFAKENGITLIEHLPAHWYDKDDERYKPFAYTNYFDRNTKIADDSDVLLAFCLEGSRGTMDTYKKAKARDVRAFMFTEKDVDHE